MECKKKQRVTTDKQSVHPQLGAGGGGEREGLSNTTWNIKVTKRKAWQTSPHKKKSSTYEGQEINKVESQDEVEKD